TCGELGVFTRAPVARFEVVSFALRSTYNHHVRLAQAGAPLDQRVEDWLELESRAADDLEPVGGHGLLLEGFTQIARARLNLVEQANVLDRDHRLVGEGHDEI